MSAGVGTQFTATLEAGHRATWFTFAWDPNLFVKWSIRPTSFASDVRLEKVEVSRDELGLVYWLTISNAGHTRETFEAKYYYNTEVPEGRWRSVGPRNHISSAQYSVCSGAMVQVALDPNDSDRIYAVAQSGGLWKLESVENYPSWEWTPLSDDHDSLDSMAVAIAPSDSSVLYLAEGDQLLRSGTAGEHWEVIANRSSSAGSDLWSDAIVWGHAVRRLLVDPRDANTVLMASDTGLWRLESGRGSWTWTRLVSGNVTDVAVDPDDATIVYAAQRSVGVLKSTSSGSWDTVLPWSSIADPTNAMVKLALGHRGDSSHRTVAVKSGHRVFVNDRSGADGHWSPSTLPADPESQGGWTDVIAIDPFDDDVILAGEETLYRTHTGGRSGWESVAGFVPNTVHEDQQCVAFDTSARGVVYLSNDGGVFRSTDGGRTWRSGSWRDVLDKADLTQGLVTVQFERVALSSDRIAGPSAVGPAWHQGVLASRSIDTSQWQGVQGHSWEAANSYAFANQPGVFYLFRGGGGADNLWRQYFPPRPGEPSLHNVYPGIHPTAIGMDNRRDSQLLLLGTANGRIHFTADPSVDDPSWSEAASVDFGEAVASIALAPSRPGTAYAVSSSGHVVKCSDVSSPGTWNDAHSDLDIGAEHVLQLAVAPHDDTKLYLVSQRHVAVSTNGGSHWSVLTDASSLGTKSLRSIVCHPLTPDVVFVAGNPGVFATYTGGDSWVAYDDGLPKADVSWLQWHGGRLVAATWGRGLWERTPFGPRNEGDDMTVRTQFSATLRPGHTERWTTWGWPHDELVLWSVRPVTDNGKVELKRLDVENAPNGLRYTLTIHNSGHETVLFEAKYGAVWF